MSNAKHTPGPWKCTPDCASDLYYEVTDDDGNALTFNDDEHEANARLIEQAPELLICLIDVCEWLESVNLGEEPIKSLQKAKAVIVQAKGEAI